MKIKFPTLFLTMCMVLTTLFPVTAFAADENPLLNTVQQSFDDLGLKTDVSEVSGDHYTEVWDNVSKLTGATEFLEKIQNDGFSLYQEIAAFRVDDTIGTNSMYFISHAYKNDADDIVTVVYVYNPRTNNIVRVFAAKVDTNGYATEYYEYEGKFVMTRDVTGNDLSFFCGMSSTVVCTIWTAMFMALPIVGQIAAGLSCGAAFAYVCSYA